MGVSQAPEHSSIPTLEEAKRTWKQAVAAYQNPDLKGSIWQLVNSIPPYLFLWYVAYRLLPVSYLLTLFACAIAGGFMVRIFIIFHDCGHGSFFKSKRANSIVGAITGILTFTPFDDWRREHALHHASAGDLERRGVGDVWMMTVEEYQRASRWQRFSYRLYRNPFIMFGLGPLIVFFIKQRFPRTNSGARERLSVFTTDLALVAIIAPLIAAIGWKAFVLVQLPIMAFGGALGVWLFYIQHQFETVYWERGARRDFVAAAMLGSSLYTLPKILQWFTGNIGFHHIHHLSPKIPNYKLEKCYKEQTTFQAVDRITLRSSLHSLRLRLYDEGQRRMVTFRQAMNAQRQTMM